MKMRMPSPMVPKSRVIGLIWILIFITGPRPCVLFRYVLAVVTELVIEFMVVDGKIINLRIIVSFSNTFIWCWQLSSGILVILQKLKKN